MSQDSTAPNSWQSIAAELRAYRQQQQQTWGDLDHALIGRYLAGETTPEERARVEASLDQHPELRVLTDVVSEVLGESAPPIEEPKVIPFTGQRQVLRSRFQRYQRRFALAAAACLLVGLSFLLNQHSSAPDGTTSPPNSESFQAARDSIKGVSLLRPGGVEPGVSPVHETDLLARADALVDKDRFKEAAESLETWTKSKKKNVISPVVDPGKPSDRGFQVAAKLTERFLKSMPPPETDIKETEFTAFAAPKNVTAAKMSDASAARSYILSQSVPYLIDGLKTNDKALRDRSTEILTRMGAYDSNAVPALTETLQCADTAPSQQAAVVNVLKQIGPRARQAEPVLDELARKGCKVVSPRAQEALSSVRMPVWVGVRDRANVLNAEAETRINERIRELGKQHQLYVLAETISLPTEVKREYTASKSDEKMNGYISRPLC